MNRMPTYVAGLLLEAGIGAAWLAYFGPREVRHAARRARSRIGDAVVGSLAVGVVVGAVALGATLAAMEYSADAVLDALDGDPDPADVASAWVAVPGRMVH